jgi:hypothetical protein
MPSAIENLADKALMAVLTADGNVCGTGFMVDADSVLTCHHVVDGAVLVKLQDPERSIHSVSRDAILSAPEIDLALLRVPGLHGTPLPLATGTEETAEYWTKGFHWLSPSIRAAFPVQGTIAGTTSVSYSTPTREYCINDVLVLRDDDIEPGLSGAPVLDRSAGVVVGIISTQLTRKNQRGGFAIPIGQAASQPALAPIVAHNAASVPAYGVFLNAPAARDLCAAVTGGALEGLATLRGVNLDRRVTRAEIEAVINQFMASDEPLLALVGPSGAGKSTELAALAQRTKCPTMLLRGSAIRRDCTDLGDAVTAALNQVPGLPLLPDRPDRALTHALVRSGGLMILLDGLNEAAMSVRRFEEWIASTRTWLQQTSSRLIISCQPELWHNVGHLLEAPFGDRKPIVVSLAKFASRTRPVISIAAQLHEAARVFDLFVKRYAASRKSRGIESNGRMLLLTRLADLDRELARLSDAELKRWSDKAFIVVVRPVRNSARDQMTELRNTLRQSENADAELARLTASVAQIRDLIRERVPIQAEEDRSRKY